MMIRFILLITVFFIGVRASAQPSSLSTKNKKAIELYVEADNYRVRTQYTQAIQLLNQAISKDKDFVEAYYRLSLVYKSLRDYQKSISLLEDGLSRTKDPKKQKMFWLELSENYFAEGHYEKALKMAKDFIAAERLNTNAIAIANKTLRNAEFALQHQNAEAASQRKVLSDTVNAAVLQYFPAITADQQQLFFTRQLTGGPNDDEDIVVSKKNERGRWMAPESISAAINTKLNEGTCSISADGTRLIFTSCAGRGGVGSCDLYESRKVGDDWSVPKNLGPAINSPDWESQPSLSADGRTLYFISDRRNGSVGRRDIWVSTQNEKGEWTKAKNIGKPINSEYDEYSPFIHANNKVLFFASKGPAGFGGYDIFFSERDSADGWSEPVNFGPTVNDHEDQFSLVVAADGKRAFYSHEEALRDGYSRSKIYEIALPEANQVRFKSNYVKGIVRDKETQKPLRARIELINIARNQVESIVESDSVSGRYLMVLTQGAEYALYINKTQYVFQSLNFDYVEMVDFKPITLNVELEKIRTGSRAVLKNIFFDVDKVDLKEKSVTELEKVIQFLKNNPSLRMEISGHTDNTGSPQYNRQLSERRARSVYDYLVRQGVNPTRLTTKGYGSEAPLGQNDTEDGKKLNRRIEFKIL